jgi:hypothetical protein
VGLEGRRARWRPPADRRTAAEWRETEWRGRGGDGEKLRHGEAGHA